MVSFTSLLLAALTTISLTAAAPSQITRRQSPACAAGSYVHVDLIGAADGAYSIDVPCDGGFTATNNPLSISHVQTNSGPCLIIGSDWNFQFQEAGFTDFGPPQTVVGVVCGFSGQ